MSDLKSQKSLNNTIPLSKSPYSYLSYSTALALLLPVEASHTPSDSGPLLERTCIAMHATPIGPCNVIGYTDSTDPSPPGKKLKFS
jgi:hypothetical protein